MASKLFLLLTVILLLTNSYTQPVSQINGDYYVDQIGSTPINKAFTINI